MPITPHAGSVEFDPFSQEFFDGAYETYRRLRDEAPVYYNAKWDFWALTRYDDVAPATKDHETYSSAKGATLDMVKAHDDAIPVPKVIISMDPPEHQKMRKLVSNVFTPRAIASLGGHGSREGLRAHRRTGPGVIRRGRRLLGALSKRRDYHDARGAERGSRSNPALGGPLAGTPSRRDRRAGNGLRGLDEHGHLLLQTSFKKGAPSHRTT